MGIISKVLNLQTEIEPNYFQQPVFVVGCMRSGTSLLQNTLDEHPQLLKIGFELNDIWTKIGGANCMDNCSHKTASHLDMTFAHNMTNYFSESIREAKTFMRHVERLRNRWRFGSGGVFYDWENLIPVNKSPHLMNKIGYVGAMYPKAKFILIVRSIFGQSSSLKMHLDKYSETEDVVGYLPDNGTSCWSIYRGRHDKPIERSYPGNFEMIPEAWMRLNSLAVSELSKMDDDRYIIISYENLVKEQYKVLKRVFDFLDLSDKHKKVEEELFSRSRKLMNNHTGNPLYSWKDKLDADEIGTINKVIEENYDDYEIIQNSLISSAREKWKSEYKISEQVLELS